MKRPKFIVLANGDAIRADWIGAVRLGDEIEARPPIRDRIKPRVIVDFGSTDPSIHRVAQINCTIVYFDDSTGRDEYARTLRAEIELALENQK